ncbi:hypothetical protein K7X08_023544 [Anisodus acutangulus]|uniref:Uncharacterized protein n=1 Tax=Anisodus acutangulus TaxID=402998 RepID=A0A9Q1L6X9_9SOLA|nr:hypothetical protein K7X08_023544 [Anisodus acutangulus]
MEASRGPMTEKAGRCTQCILRTSLASMLALCLISLLSENLWDMTQANGEAFDFFGRIATKMEWGILYLLARDEDGFLSKEAIRRCFDGSLFDYCAKVKMGGDFANKQE